MDTRSDEKYGTPPHPDCVIWTYKKGDGTEVEIFDDALALATLLMEGCVYINTHWGEKEWPPEAQQTISFNVGCNDIFSWGCADSEEMGYEDLRSVYEHSIKDRKWGTAIWCMKKRKEMPQRPVEKDIRKEGIWDMDALRREFCLRPNQYDGISYVLADQKYRAYMKRKLENGEVPLPFDVRWWKGLNEYIEHHPEWETDAWKLEEDRLCAEWKKENGYG